MSTSLRLSIGIIGSIELLLEVTVAGKDDVPLEKALGLL